MSVPRSTALLAALALVAGHIATAAVTKATTKATPKPAQGPAPSAPITAEQLGSFRWRSIGPANMGGRVADIAGHPSNPGIFYVALGTGGVFKTENHGTTWKGVFDDQPVASIGAVAIASSKPDVVWVGTGEGNSRNSSSWGNGVYRSEDGGKKWRHLGLDETHNIPRLAVHPKNPDSAYVCALGHLWGDNPERGVFKTADGGKTWQHVLKLDARTGCVDIVLDPESPDTVFAAMYGRKRSPWSYESGSPAGGIYKTVDGGAHWAKLANGLPERTGRIGIDVARSKPGVVYAVIESDEGGNVAPFDVASRSGGVFRSDDRGETWKRVSKLAPRPFYFARVRVDPADDQHLWVLGVDLYVSKDGGATWSRKAADKAHVDFHAMWIDPNNPKHVLAGSDGGIYASWDAGATFAFVNNLAIGEFYNLAVDMQRPYRVCGGLQDNGTWCGPFATRYNNEDEDGEAFGQTVFDWRFINGGDGFHVAIDPTNPNIVFAESQGGALNRIRLDTGVRKSLRPEAREGQPAYRFNWNTPFVISHHDPTVLYLGGNVLFRLSERGDRFEAISPDLTTRDAAKMASAGSSAENYCTIVALSESPKDKNVLWVGTDDGNVRVTRDGGANWTNVEGKLPAAVRGFYVSRVEASYHDPARAYVAVEGHRSDNYKPFLYASDDYGVTLRSIAEGLPASGIVKVVREDPANPDLLFCGTEFGAFVSFDRGAHWTPLKEGLPTVAVDDILIHPRDRDLLIGTHGRSIYALDDITPLEQATTEVRAKDYHLFTPRAVHGFQTLPYGGIWGGNIFTAKNPPFGAIVYYWSKTFSTEQITFTITDAKSRKVRELKSSPRPGFNRVVWDLQGEKDERISSGRGRGGQPDLVAPGEYTIAMRVRGGGEEQKVKLVVTAEEGVGKGALEP